MRYNAVERWPCDQEHVLAERMKYSRKPAPPSPKGILASFAGHARWQKEARCSGFCSLLVSFLTVVIITVQMRHTDGQGGEDAHA